MLEDSDLFEDGGTFKCDRCGKEIPAGESMWSVNLHHETFEYGGLTVHEADGLRIYCEACADKFNFYKVSIPLKRPN